jgi:DNA polymerase III delta subunit
VARAADPRQQWNELEGSLAAGLAPGYLLRYDEPWFGARALDLLRGAARGAGLELCSHDAQDAEFRLSSLLDDLCGNAMFAQARCVLVERPEEHLKKGGDTDSALTRAARAFLEARRGTLILVTTSLRLDHAVVKAIKQAQGGVYEFRALYDAPPPWDPDPYKSEVVIWVANRARELGLKLTREDALLLSKVKGNDLSALDSELSNLREAGPEAVSTLVSDAAGSPGRLADHLSDGDAAAALVEIERLWQGGFDKGKGGGRETAGAAILAVLFGRLRGNLRQAMVGSAAMAAGADAKSAADEAAVPTWPQARQAFTARVGARSSGEWLRMQRDMHALERRTRMGGDVDANDLALFALRWRRVARERGAARARAVR